MRTDTAQRPAALVGLATLLVLLVVMSLDPGGFAARLRAAGQDLILSIAAPPKSEPAVVVVDIDRASLATHGAWPWRRGLIADLLEVINRADPKVVAIDILLRGPDRRSPAAALRAIGTETARPDLAAIADSLPDDDARLATAISAGTVVLGLALDPDSQDQPPFAASILSKGPMPALALRAATGVAAPLPALADASTGIGVLSLQAGPGDLVRDVPLFAFGGGEVFAGLALEAVRAAEGAAAYVVDPVEGIGIGEIRVPLTGDGTMRLHFAPTAQRSATIVSAADILSGRADPAVLAGRIVLIGASAPEAGARLATPVEALMPTTLIQAEAIGQIRAGWFPQEPAQRPLIDLALALALGLVAIAVAILLPPLAATAALLGLGLAFTLAVLGVLVATAVLLDPLVPLLPAAIAANVAATVHFARTRRLRAAIERKFARYVSPEVVRRLTLAPEELKIEGEIREVTALFSDIEGFTTMTERAEPRALVAALDAYFEGVCAIIIAHGGMVDKLVGDAAHGLFNAPLDLPDHARRALDCAIAIDRFARRFRLEPGPKALGFGRTRIGFETGPVIVGDVGGLGHLDYTAHGDAVNSAARLEALNKQFGSTIAIGPRAAAAIGAAVRLRPLGHVTLRGRSGESLVYTVWPEGTPGERMAAHEAAFALLASDRSAALAAFEALVALDPNDPVSRYWLTTLSPAPTA